MELYHYLLKRYDQSLSPEKARQRLTMLKASRTDTLAKLISTILKLTHQASLILPPECRSILSDLEACQHLIEALPQSSSQFCMQRWTDMKIKQKVPRFFAFVQVLDPFREMIDQDIAENGVQERSQNYKYKGKTVNLLTKSNEQPAKKQFVDTKRNGYEKKNYQNNSPNTWKRTGNNNMNNQNKEASGRQSTWRQNGNNNNNKPKEQKFCSLCGQWSHNASDGCRCMMNAEGKVVPCVIPVKQICSNCSNKVHTPLHHKAEYCIFRPEVKDHIPKRVLNWNMRPKTK